MGRRVDFTPRLRGITDYTTPPRGVNVVLWDFVPKCYMEKCIIFEICAYKKDPKRKCGLERMYFSNICVPYIELAKRVSKAGKEDPFILQWLGLHIMPLYRQLVKFSKEEIALKAACKGPSRKPHPVYKEIRHIIRAIRLEWNESGLADLAQRAGYLKGLRIPDTPVKGRRPGRPKKKVEDVPRDRWDDWYSEISRKADDEDEEP